MENSPQRIENVHSSPEDVKTERKKTKEVIDEVNQYLRSTNCHIELLRWEDALPGAGRPQELINKFVDSCDLFIGILGQRWGSPTGIGNYSSGFEEEFNRAMQRRKQSKEPQIWLAFKKVKKELLQNPDGQLKKVIDFKAQQIEVKQAMFKEFSGPRDWEKKLRSWLTEYVLEFHNAKQTFEEVKNISLPPQTEVKTFLEPSSKTNQTQSYLQIEKIASDLSSFAKAQHEAHKTPEYPDIHQIARLQLFSTAITASEITGETFPVHETNFLYKNKEQIIPTEIERRLIFRTMVGAARSDNIPGWFWFSALEEGDLKKLLFDIAASDPESDVKENAINLLSDICISPDEEFYARIKELLKDKNNLVRRAAADYFIEFIEREDLPIIKNIIKENFLLDDKNKIDYLRKFVESDPNGALSLILEEGFYFDAGKIYEDFSPFVSQVKDSLLFKAVDNYQTPIKIAAFRELISRKLLIGHELKKFVNEHFWGYEKLLADLEMLQNGEDVDINVTLSEIDSEYISKEAEEHILKLLTLIPITKLISHIDFYSPLSPVILKSIANVDFFAVSELIRENLDTEFEALKSKSIKIERKEVSTASLLIAPFFTRRSYTSADSDKSSKERLIAVSLDILNDFGKASDIQFGRKYIVHTNDSIKAQAIRIIDQFGDVSDLETLINIATSSDPGMKNMAATISLKFSPGFVEISKKFLQSKNETLIALALKEIWDEKYEKVQESIWPLFENINENIRLMALAWLNKKLTSDQLENLLKAYVEQNTYYYNIVCWLDRLLYSPQVMRNVYARNLNSLVFN